MARRVDRGLPRRWTLPNAPAVFVGRTRERAWADAALERGVVTVLSGPPGIGKTALSLVVAAGRREPTLLIAAGSNEPAEQTSLEVVRALSEGTGRAVEVPGMQSSFDARLDATLALARSWAGLIVVDGLAASEPEGARWLDELAGYAQGSRFLVATRAIPESSRLDGQVLALGPLDVADTRELAALWAPRLSTSEQQRLARRSRGEPGALRRLVQGSGDEHAISAPGTTLLQLLGAIGQPVPEPVLTRLASADVRDELIASGLLRPVGDAFEPWVEPGPPPEPAVRDAVVALLLDKRPETTLALVALLAHTMGDPARLRALLDERGEALLRAGYASRLWSALRDVPAEAVEGWQLRCAHELGNPTALARAYEPGQDAPSDRLLWARTLLARGLPREAREAATPLVRDPALAVDAAYVAAAAAAAAGDTAGALTIVEAARPSDEAAALRLRVARARWAIEHGTPEPARTLAALGRELESAGAAGETWRTLAAAFERRGELDAALEILEREDGDAAARPELWGSRVSLLLRASIAVQRGEPLVARELVALVAPYAREPSALASPLDACVLAARFLEGQLEDFEPALALAVARAKERDATVLVRLRDISARFARAVGRAPQGDDEPGSGPDAVWRMRWGGAGTGPTGGTDRRDEVWDAIAMACEALARGSFVDASTAAQRGAAEADRWGYAELGLEARVVWAEALAGLGERRSLGELAGQLVARARDCGSRRIEEHGRFFASIARGRLDPAEAEALAAQRHVAPTVARWARATLGGDVPLDVADRALLAALRDAGAVGDVKLYGHASGAPDGAWGLDLAERVAWLPDGRRIELGARPVQWRILETLAAMPGLQADKETLVCRAWNEASYHPGRHDPRLYVAIRKLRSALEDEPSQPVRLITTDDGYALGQPIRLTR